MHLLLSSFRSDPVYVARVKDARAYTSFLILSSSSEVLAEQAAIFRERRGFFNPIPDSSCIMKPVLLCENGV